MNARVLLLAALLLVPSTAHAQETFSPSGVDDSAAALAPTPAPASADWWRAQAPTLPPPRPPKPLALRFDGGYAPRRLFSLSVTGADFGLALGAQTSHHTAWWAASRLSIGTTDNGLSVWSGRAGAEVEAVYDPVRFGIGAGFMLMGVDRSVRDQTLLSYGVEARAFARVDITRNDDYALFVRGGVDAAAEAYGGSVFWGPMVGVGVELGVRGQRPAAWQAAIPRPPSQL